MKSVKPITLVMATYRHPWELSQALFSFENQHNISHDEYDILVLNDDPKDLQTKKVVLNAHIKYGNIRYVEVYDAEESGITNADRTTNIGVRMFVQSAIVIIVIDCCRLITPGLLAKTRDAFEEYGLDVTTSAHPYHIGKHYTDQTWTVKECRNLMDNIKWRENGYNLFNVAAHTYISRTGRTVESTFQGITWTNYMKLGGLSEEFKSWGLNNLDFWRRCTLPKPEGGIQEVGVSGKWGKVGLGLKSILIEKEGTFHIHHDVFVGRGGNRIKADTEMIWKFYEEHGDCIYGNSGREDEWGIGNVKEIEL